MATRRATRRRTTSRTAVFHCLFCGTVLRRGRRRDAFTCQRCHALFIAGRNAQGCVVQMSVDHCGAEPCCLESCACPPPSR